MKLITTSWDDGYHLDDRIAELMSKYGIKGTFYIPQSNLEHEVMAEASVQALSRHHEIGGHTLQHTRIHDRSEKLFDQEIGGCYRWLTDLVGKAPDSFCFPGGVYNQEAVHYCRNKGFKIIRTTELLSTRLYDQQKLTPTTLQVYHHTSVTFYKHLLKRGKWSSLLLYTKLGGSGDLLKLVHAYIEELIKTGGCFHLWGHSWEIEEFGLWDTLEAIFKIVSQITEVDYVENRDLAHYA